MFCLSNKDEFQCKSDECVKWSYVCDGVSHCSNKADEDCDMCTNDLYLCKDSSRINCTLACSTLGYIPCKNYVDKKICATVIKKASKYLNFKSSSLNKQNNELNSNIFQSSNNDYLASSNYFNKNSGIGGGVGHLDGDFNNNQKSSFFKSLPSNEKFLFSGIFILISFVIIFLLFGVLYNRYKQKKRGFSTTTLNNSLNNTSNNTNMDENNNNLNNTISSKQKRANNFTSQSSSITTSLSNNSLVSPDLAYLDDQVVSDMKKYSTINSNKKKKEANLVKSCQPYPSQLSKSNEILFKTSNSNEKTNDSNGNFEIIDYQIYGEPPPSYKLSKYYPKATIKATGQISTAEPLLKNNESFEEDKYAHIYENIDEVSLTSESLKDNNEQIRSIRRDSNGQIVSVKRQTSAGAKRAKFQALKKHSLNSSCKLNKKSIDNSEHQQQQQQQQHQYQPDTLIETNTDNNKNKIVILTSSPSTSSSSSSNSIKNKQIVSQQNQKIQVNKSTSEQFL